MALSAGSTQVTFSCKLWGSCDPALKGLLKNNTRAKKTDGTARDIKDHVGSELLVGFTFDWLVKHRAFEVDFFTAESVLLEKHGDSSSIVPEPGECQMCGLDQKEHNFLCSHPLWSELVQTAAECKKTKKMQSLTSAFNAVAVAALAEPEKKTKTKEVTFVLI